MNSSGHRIDVMRGDGQYDVREVLRMSWFLRTPHLQSNHAVADAIEHLMQTPVGDSWRFASEPSGDWRQRSREGLMRSVREALVDEARTINGTISLSNDPNQTVPDFYAEYNGFAIDRPRFKDRAGFLFLWVPEPWFRTNRDLVISTVSQVASKVAVSFACADLALLGKPERVQQLARRYLGVDVSDISSTAIDLGDKVPGAYWLGIYSPPTAGLLRAWLARSPVASQAWSASDLPDGRLMLIETSGPSRGDRHRHEALADRRALAAVLAENGVLHFPQRSTYFEKSGEQTGDELQTMWHRRFLDKTW